MHSRHYDPHAHARRAARPHWRQTRPRCLCAAADVTPAAETRVATGRAVLEQWGPFDARAGNRTHLFGVHSPKEAVEVIVLDCFWLDVGGGAHTWGGTDATA